MKMEEGSYSIALVTVVPPVIKAWQQEAGISIWFNKDTASVYFGSSYRKRSFRNETLWCHGELKTLRLGHPLSLHCPWLQHWDERSVWPFFHWPAPCSGALDPNIFTVDCIVLSSWGNKPWPLFHSRFCRRNVVITSFQRLSSTKGLMLLRLIILRSLNFGFHLFFCFGPNIKMSFNCWPTFNFSLVLSGLITGAFSALFKSARHTRKKNAT